MAKTLTNLSSNETEHELTQTPALNAQSVSYAFAKRNGVMLGQIDEDKAQLLYRGKLNPQAISEVRRIIGRRLELSNIADEQFDALLAQTYEQNSDQAMAMMEGVSEELDLDQLAETIEPEDLLEAEDDAPIIKLINAVLTEAIKISASDIHIEAFENRMRIRFRVDGVLREILQPPKNIAPLVISRIKVMAKLDIAEKRLPQDGRISLKVAGRSVDVRVSTLQSGHGERIVLRLLDKQAGRLDLQHLGMSDNDSDRLNDLLHHPHGIILVTGPTGSGKTTTLYTAISSMNSIDRSIFTLEDPVEYMLPMVRQTQVNSDVGTSFADGLRAILRQDPDIILLGEIRDSETATLAVRAALTGHLVLSSLHTNDAAGAVPRLIDMGVEPYLIPSCQLGVVSQRLVRKLCPHCSARFTPQEAMLERLGVVGEVQDKYHFWQAVGCERCDEQGYRGRIALYEIMAMTENFHDDIIAGQHVGRDLLRKSGMTFMLEDGLDKMSQGLTSVDEVLRVVSDA